MNSHLLRRLAPISSEAWDQIDQEAKDRLPVALGARKLVDFAGPFGWDYSATNLGRAGAVVEAPAERVIARTRQVLPLTELRADFTLDREELVAASRGALDVDYTPLDEAAHRIASAENAAIFSGWDSSGIGGIVPQSPHDPIRHDSGTSSYDDLVATAVSTLKQAGIGGPYALALGPGDWTAVFEASDEGGYPLIRHLRELLDGPIEWVPGLDVGVVLSMRGGDYLLEVGEDLSIGYESHTAETVGLYFEETFSFRVATPEAAVAIERVVNMTDAATGARNVVLVHGAYADGSSWLDVIPLLQEAGLSVTSVQNPLTSLEDDVAATRRILDLQDGPTVLVGHSWAGTVISEAGVHPNVVALVYVAARAPDAGEDYGELAGRFPSAPASAGLVHAGGFGQLSEDAFLNDFANGVDRVRARALFAVQGRISDTLFASRTTEAAWRGKPSWYAVSTEDRTTSPELESFLAERMKAVTIRVPSGHLSMVTHPREIADLILEASKRPQLADRPSLPASSPRAGPCGFDTELANTLPRCHSTGPWADEELGPDLGFAELSAARRAISVSCAVRSFAVSTERARTVSPVAASSRRVRSAKPAIPASVKNSWAARSCSRASMRRPLRRATRRRAAAAGQRHADAGATEALDRLLVQGLGDVIAAEKGTAARHHAQQPFGARGSSDLRQTVEGRSSTISVSLRTAASISSG